MPTSGLEGEKGPHTISAQNFKLQEGLKMYGQLPNYDVFQGYDLGIDSELSRIAEIFMPISTNHRVES